MQSRRVLVLNERDPSHPRAGGAEIHVKEIFSRLAKRGFSVTLASSSFDAAASGEEMDGIEIRRLGRVPSYYPRAAWSCARETRRQRFDVVVECLNKLPFYAPVYSAVPVLALCHHLFGETAFRQVPWPVAAAVWTAERAIPRLYRGTPFVTISESSRADLVARGIPRSRIQVIHCGAEQPSVPFESVAKRGQRVVYVGRLEPYKRVDVLLRAMKQLAERFPEAEAVIIGRGTAQSQLEDLARELGIAEKTRFVGFVPDEERDALIASCRVCVCPSEKEGWGLTVIEANAVGTPVVASDAPGLRDSIVHGETGFLAPEADASAFAERIAELLADDALAERLSVNALRWSRRFSWDQAASEMGEALLSLAASG